jgi:hypothetical protein
MNEDVGKSKDGGDKEFNLSLSLSLTLIQFLPWLTLHMVGLHLISTLDLSILKDTFRSFETALTLQSQ